MESQNSDITTSSTEEYCNKISKENNMDVDPCPPNTSSWADQMDYNIPLTYNP